ncbi:MAG: acyl carrier protein, partial [Anaerolineales bacterium]
EILNQPDRKLNPDDKLISSGLIDSLSLVDIALYVEEEFQVIIDDTELNSDTFDTLAELVDLIQTRR